MSPASRALLGLLALLVSACAELPFIGKASDAPGKAPPAPVSAAVAAPGKAAPPAPATRPAISLPEDARLAMERQDRLAAMLGTLPSRPEKPLIGLRGKAVVELLGPPGFIHRDRLAEIWRYRGENCLLDLFLYRQGKTMRVRHAEARGKQVEQTGVTDCLRAILRAGG